jgi:membrane fusion protein (multidrug efflux system)
VNGDLIRIQPQVSGTVALITTDEAQPVRQGQLLIELDRRDAEVALEQAKANLAQSIRDVQQLTRQALASLDSHRTAIAATEPETHPRVLLAESSVRSAWLAWSRTRVLAPASGYLVRRAVQLGQQVTPATETMAIAPLDSLWINANFKEMQLQKLRIGQPVTVHADSYGSHFEYHGKVLGLTAGTGAALAVLPPENPTGNWIKIVQRVPVRIGLDPGEVQAHPLFLGLSTTVKVDVHDLSGSPLSEKPVWPTGLRADVYSEQDAGVDAEIQRIVRENLVRSAQDSRPRQVAR